MHRRQPSPPAHAALDDRAVTAIAARVAELLAADDVRRSEPLVEAGELARRHGVSRSFVYAHAVEFGAIRLGIGRRPRLRFDARIVARVLVGRECGVRDGRDAPPHRQRRRRTTPAPTDAPLLAIRGLE
jgi:hypothetical protein